MPPTLTWHMNIVCVLYSVLWEICWCLSGGATKVFGTVLWNDWVRLKVHLHCWTAWSHQTTTACLPPNRWTGHFTASGQILRDDHVRTGPTVAVTRPACDKEHQEKSFWDKVLHVQWAQSYGDGLSHLTGKIENIAETLKECCMLFLMSESGLHITRLFGKHGANLLSRQNENSALPMVEVDVCGRRC